MKPLKVLSSHSEWFHSCGSEYTRVGQRFTVIFFSIITGDVIITFSGSVWSCSLNSKCHSLKPKSVQRSVSQEFSWSAFWRFAAENLWTSSEKEEKLKQMQMFLIPTSCCALKSSGCGYFRLTVNLTKFSVAFPDLLAGQKVKEVAGCLHVWSAVIFFIRAARRVTTNICLSETRLSAPSAGQQRSWKTF